MRRLGRVSKNRFSSIWIVGSRSRQQLHYSSTENTGRYPSDRTKNSSNGIAKSRIWISGPPLTTPTFGGYPVTRVCRGWPLPVPPWLPFRKSQGTDVSRLLRSTRTLSWNSCKRTRPGTRRRWVLGAEALISGGNLAHAAQHEISEVLHVSLAFSWSFGAKYRGARSRP